VRAAEHWVQADKDPEGHRILSVEGNERTEFRIEGQIGTHSDLADSVL